jgi:hypothetical protein
MPRIRCRYLDCVYLDDGYCSSEVVEIDPDEGCMTFTLITDANVDDDWDDEKIEDLWDVDDDDLLVDDDDDLDLWLEEDL